LTDIIKVVLLYKKYIILFQIILKGAK